MTRKRKHDIERDLADLAADGGDEGPRAGVVVLWPGDDRDADAVEDAGIVIDMSTCVMRREQAEREGYEILGPAEEVPADDAVRVVRESSTPADN
jgi:hypothetical protein